jgi:hypothetical protein
MATAGSPAAQQAPLQTRGRPAAATAAPGAAPAAPAATPAAPNVFTQSAGALTNAIDTANRAATYQPLQVTAPTAGTATAGAALSRAATMDPSLARADTMNAALMKGAGYGADQMNAAAMKAAQAKAAGYDARKMQADQIAGRSLDPYMNPYTQSVIDTSIADMNRARQMTQNQNGAAATAAGAFGGSRLGLVEAETNRGFLDEAGRLSAELRNQGYMNAQDLASQDVAATNAARSANQQAVNQSREFNAGNRQQTRLSNQAAKNTARQFNAANRQDARATNMAAVNQQREFNAGNTQQARLANQASRNAARSANQDANNTFRLSNQSARNDARAFNATNRQNTQFANQNARNDMRQFNATARNDMTQFNANQGMQAQLANQSAGLSGIGQNLAAAGQLGNLANLGFGMGQEINKDQLTQGSMQQQLMQSLIDAARGQYAGWTGAPADSLKYPLAALGAAPQESTTTQKSNPGLLNFLSLGLGLL